MKPIYSQSGSPSDTPTQSVGHIGALRAALESFQDGFIIASQSGEVHQINGPAERICQQLRPAPGSLPTEIWWVCESAMVNQEVLSFQKIGLDAEIVLPGSGTVRVRVQNIQVAQIACLLIVLEDRQQTIFNRALSEAALFGLTARETEVWQLRLRGDGYKEISAALWISVDTVKKHVKNILAKRRSHEDELDYLMTA
ncbi:MAG: helix-turn-helix transcriptional regulator [Phormidesmis sp.]